MALVDLEDFGDKEMKRVFIASSREQTERVKELLDDEQIDYAINIEPYSPVTGLIMSASEKQGVAFYVLARQSDHCRNIIKSHGLDAGIHND